MLAGDWKLIEITDTGTKQPLESFGVQCITFNKLRVHECVDKRFVMGEWVLNNDKLKLHRPVKKDLSGNIMEQAHNSEWYIEVNEQFMVWQGISEYSHLQLTWKKGD